MQIHLLDMGAEKYGDCILLTQGERTILIDGGHPGDTNAIRAQLRKLLKKNPPFTIDLLIVTHCHNDHIGCLPALVKLGDLHVKTALLADPALRWGEEATLELDQDQIFSDKRLLRDALDEEERSNFTDDELEQFLIDTAGLLPNYLQMITTLQDQSEVILFHGVTEQFNPYKELEEAFADFGLKLLGPSPEHLELCADYLDQHRQRDQLSDFLQTATDNQNISLTAIYRQITSQLIQDSRIFEDRAGPGAAINDQSIVLSVQSGQLKALFGGDMQFAKAEVPGLKNEMEQLLLRVNKEDYSFIKLTHHTSYNGMNEGVIEHWLGKTRLFAHTGGWKDPGHPEPEVLAFLAQQENINFTRTDRNGLITIEEGSEGKLDVYFSKGEPNDFTPNRTEDVPSSSGYSAAIATNLPSPPPLPPVAEPPTTLEKDFVEITARVPHTSTRVTITIDVDPEKKKLSPPELPPVGDRDGVRFHNLLFVTNQANLERNIGKAETAQVISYLQQLPGAKWVNCPSFGKATEAAAFLRPHLNPAIRGIVLVGGYDVLPALQLDVLDPALRAKLRASGGESRDSDGFVVWSDDIYGDTDDDSLPEYPVSRIPDGRSADLLWAALRAPRFQPTTRFGIRNLARPFAEQVFQQIPGQPTTLEVSEQCSPQRIPQETARGAVYFMLHGIDHDATRFWGETSGGNSYEAVNIDNIPKTAPGTIVFTGCCWGALTVQPPAGFKTPHMELRPRTPEQSIALSYLKAGALAFVGCTGTHYSPDKPPYQFFGKPMHDAFWNAIREGLAPAEALFKAKQQYASKIPHRENAPIFVAIELKIFRQFTCLGLGW